MDLERYEYERKRTYKEYFFYSEGPKGHIRKIVRFVLTTAYPQSYYNLVFGDWNEAQKIIYDKVITNNGDTEKVLATVAAIVLNFTDILSLAIVYAKGSNPARTRLYQININKFWCEIEKIFDVYGRIDNQLKLESFKKNVNYSAFLIVRKGNIIKDDIILEEQTETYMTSSQENKEAQKRVYNDRIVDGPELVDIENDPVVLKKIEAAKKDFEECPIPEWILKKHNLL